mgnify:CR=1 FL=1
MLADRGKGKLVIHGGRRNQENIVNRCRGMAGSIILSSYLADHTQYTAHNHSERLPESPYSPLVDYTDS